MSRLPAICVGGMMAPGRSMECADRPQDQQLLQASGASEALNLRLLSRRRTAKDVCGQPPPYMSFGSQMTIEGNTMHNPTPIACRNKKGTADRKIVAIDISGGATLFK